MPVFVEDPAHLSKSRLKSDLVAHNVELPPDKSKKEVYVELHLKHVDQKNATDFSSDEEDQVQDAVDKGKNSEDTEMSAPSDLTDDDLKAVLLEYGVKAGPMVASTRAVYEKKLSKLLQSDGRNRHIGAEEGVLYSDSEEEEENGEDEMLESDADEDKSEQVQQESSQNGGFAYPQCFLPPSRLHVRASKNRAPSPQRNSGNALQSSERSQSRCSQILIPRGSQLVMANGCSLISSQAFSITQMVEEMESQRSLSACTDTDTELNGRNVQEHWSQSNRLDMPFVDKCTMMNQSLYYTPKVAPHECGIKLPQEPEKDPFEDMFPDAETTPTGIYATRRRPIKGAAGRPVQYVYPDTPVSPTTQERREVERRLLPIQIQMLVFLAVACALYLIYVFVEF